MKNSRGSAAELVMRLYLLGLIYCLSLLALAYFLQYSLDLEPCSLCLLQRYNLIIITFIFLIGVSFATKTRWLRGFIKFFAFLFACFGTALAARHWWLQHLPLDQVPNCSAELEYLMQIYPLLTALKKVIIGSAACHDIQFTFAGLSLAVWSFIGYLVLVIFCTVLLFQKPRLTQEYTRLNRTIP